MKKVKKGLILTQMIMNARPHGFTSATVTGKRGAGKTAYALKVAREIGKYDGLDEAGQWKFAIDSCIFSMDDIIKVLKSHDYKNRAKILIWDDAAVHGSSMNFFLKMKDVAILKGLMDTVRTSTEALLLTCPDQGSLLKFLRRYGDFRITVHKHDDWERRAVGYQKFRFRHQAFRERKLWVDEFSCFIPDKYYHPYMKKRDRYKDELLKELTQRKKEAERRRKKNG